MRFRKKKIVFFTLLMVYIMLAIVATAMGAASITPKEVIVVILKSLPIVGKHISRDIPNTYFSIILKVRMPRIIMASFVGMGLAVVGATFQSLFRNPMADPHILGISSGAALGATIGIVFKVPSALISSSFVTVFAFMGAMLTTIFVYYIAQVKGRVSVVNLLLAGSAVSFLLSALISIIMVFNHNDVNKIVFWMMGSFNASSWNHIMIVAPVVVIGTSIIYIFHRDLNLMLIGQENAMSLGVETERLKHIIIVTSSVMIAVCVSFSGIIGFVGFLVPHMVRLIFGPSNKYLIPFSALGGALFLLLADTVARTIVPPAELPVGAVTALIGTPYFIYLLIKMKERDV
ncbi:MAG: iron chelate uptake ABC transporter family permease subunit [Epulopiscium sp.]|nr:iron chelate uptake ABC transporter family permease subunit [Candidatus Epulonipiscium sp.]